MTSGLTPRMAACLAAIRKLTVDGVSPSVREIMVEMGERSIGGAHDALNLLKERGAIEWSPGKRRSIRIIERPTRERLAELSSEDLRAVGQDVLSILRQRAGLDHGQDARP